VTQQQYIALYVHEPSPLWIALQERCTAVINKRAYGVDELKSTTSQFFRTGIYDDKASYFLLSKTSDHEKRKLQIHPFKALFAK
jgi:hypothetical protein